MTNRLGPRTNSIGPCDPRPAGHAEGLPDTVDPNRRVRVRTWRADPPERPPWSRPRRTRWRALVSSIRLFLFLLREHGS